MARWNIHNVRMTGVSACVPKEVVHSEDFPFFDKEGAEVFNNTVGIRERRLGPDSLCASDMCQAAAEKLLAELGWEKESVDMLVFESVTGDYKTPPTSCLLQDRLGLSEDCFCVDIPMGCCGERCGEHAEQRRYPTCAVADRRHGVAYGFDARQEPRAAVRRHGNSHCTGV